MPRGHRRDVGHMSRDAGSRDAVSNDQGYRDHLADYHTQLGTHLYDLGTNVQAIRADWDGPAAQGFEDFRKMLGQWCQAGQTCLDGIRQVHKTIGGNYAGLANSGSASMSATDYSNSSN
jgi:uncharacterized protein YukE